MCPTRLRNGMIALERREAENNDARDYIPWRLFR
jgi:hypothetical protein